MNGTVPHEDGSEVVARSALWRRIWPRLIVFLGVPLVLLLGVWLLCVRMPGGSHEGPLPAPTETQHLLGVQLRAEVVSLTELGQRTTMRDVALIRAAEVVSKALGRSGLEVRQHTYVVDGVECANPYVVLEGNSLPDEVLVVGAHYDSAHGTVGANDNASGTAMMLALAQRLSTRGPFARSVLFVGFANEEPPHFNFNTMGSQAFAEHLSMGSKKVVAMLSLETLGHYSDEEGSQQYPALLSAFYPSVGNFVAFVGNVDSRALVHQSVEAFRRTAAFPSQGAALPGFLPGVGWSDHRSFWEQGVPAIMVTDTAPFRYPHYHKASDTPDKLDYVAMARIVDGLESVIAGLAGEAL